MGQIDTNLFFFSFFFAKKWPGFLLYLFVFQIVSPVNLRQKWFEIDNQHPLCNGLQDIFFFFQFYTNV